MSIIKRGNKKAVAPVIAEVLLILIVLVLAGIIIVWGLSFIPDAITKLDTPIEDKCLEVQFKADLNAYEGEEGETELSIVNTGNIPIYKVGVREEGGAKAEINEYKQILKAGQSAEIPIILSSEVTKINVIPILIGTTDDGVIQEFSCSEESWQVVTI